MSRAPCWIKIMAAMVTVATVVSGASSYLGRPDVPPLLSALLANAKTPATELPEPSMPGVSKPAAESTATADQGVEVIFLDAFDATASAVARLRSDRRVVLCHLRAGVWDPHLPDARRVDAGVVGAAAGFGDSSRWLDIRRWDLLRDVLADRVEMCAAKGFDGVAFSAVDGYTHETGFALSAADGAAFSRALIALAAGRGLQARIVADQSDRPHLR